MKGRLLLLASRMLVAQGCRVGKVSRAHSKTRRRGVVISQSRRAGRVLAQGTKVNLVVSRGRARR